MEKQLKKITKTNNYSSDKVGVNSYIHDPYFDELDDFEEKFINNVIQMGREPE